MNIQLSEKHGLNPSISLCFFCGGDKNELVIPGKLKGDKEAPKEAVWDKEPCDKCKDYMKKGIILICVDEDKTDDISNPYRAGPFVVASDDFITRSLDDDSVKSTLESRVAFVPLDAWKLLGLPMKADVQ